MSVTEDVLRLVGPNSIVSNVLVRSSTGRGIGLQGGAWSRVESCEVSGAVNAAVYVYDTGDNSWIVDNLLDDRIELEGDLPLTNVHVTGNTILNATNAGVLVNTPTVPGNSSGHIISSNLIRGSHVNGVQIDADVGTVLVCGNLSIGHSGVAVSDSGTDTQQCATSTHTHDPVWPEIMLLAPNQQGLASAGTVTGAGASDHGALTGLGDDDHTQYLLVDGTRAMTGTLDMGSQSITDVIDITGAGSTSDLQMRNVRALLDPTLLQDGFAVQPSATSITDFWTLNGVGTFANVMRFYHADHATQANDIAFFDSTPALTLQFDNSDGQWEFVAPVDFAAAVTGIAHSEIETVGADDHHIEPPHQFLLMGG